MKDKENRFEWRDYSDRSALYHGDKYIATVAYKENINRGLMFSLTVEHVHYHNHNLTAVNLDEAKQKATEIIAAEYERVLGQARAKLEEYEELADSLTELRGQEKKSPEITRDIQDKHEMEYKSPWGSTEIVTPKINCYANNDNLYLGLDYFDSDLEEWLPYGDVTVNVGNLPYLESAIDTNNNGAAIVTFLEENGFGYLTGLSIESGFCTFPVFKFNEDKLREVDGENFALYAKAHNRDFRALDDAIKEAKEQGAAEPEAHKDKTKEASLEEMR